MSLFGGSCTCTMTVQNNLKVPVTLQAKNAYQMFFISQSAVQQLSSGSGNLIQVLTQPFSMTVSPGQSETFSLFAQQGSYFPGDDNAVLSCTIQGSSAPAALTFQGAGTSSGEAPLVDVGWMLSPNGGPIKQMTGVLWNSSDASGFVQAVEAKMGPVLSVQGMIVTAGAVGGAQAAVTAWSGADTAAAVVEIASGIILGAAAVFGVVYAIAGAETNVPLTGATTIIFAPA